MLNFENTENFNIKTDLYDINFKIISASDEKIIFINEFDNFISLINEKNKIFQNSHKISTETKNVNPVYRLDKTSNLKYIAISDMFKPNKRKLSETSKPIQSPSPQLSTAENVSEEQQFLWESKYSYISTDFSIFDNSDNFTTVSNSDDDDNDDFKFNKRMHFLLLSPNGYGSTSLIHSYAKLCNLKLLISDKFTIKDDTDVFKILPKANQSIIHQNSFNKIKPNSNEIGDNHAKFNCIFFDDIDIFLHDESFFSIINKFLQLSSTPVFLTSKCPSIVDKLDISNLNIINIYKYKNQQNYEKILNFVKLIMISEGYLFSDDLLKFMYFKNNKNIKKIINYLQFWFDRQSSLFSSSMEIKTIDDLTSSLDGVKLHSIQTWTSTHVDSVNLSLRTMIVINDIFSLYSRNAIFDNLNLYNIYLKHVESKPQNYKFIKRSNPLIFFKKKYSLKIASESFNQIAILSHCNWISLCLDYYPYISFMSKMRHSNSSNSRHPQKYSYLEKRSLNLFGDEIYYLENLY